MPLTSKGAEILKNLRKEYGEEKGERVFYAMRNMGKIKGVEGSRNDMSEDEFKEMARLWDKFLGEESKEKEHKEDKASAGRNDANTTYIDRKLAHVDAICDSVIRK